MNSFFKKIFPLFLISVLFFGALLGQQQLRNGNPQDGNKKKVNFESDIARPVKVADSSVLSLVGNVVFFHNGAVITCDSAIRYNDKMMECFGNVIINKDSTFIYGDRVLYDGIMNIATVFSPIIKLVDKDAVLYTRNLSFNTLENIGHYWGGGTMAQKDNLMESERGHYYVDTRDIVCVNDVAIRNSEYTGISDSAGYNLNTEIALFYKKAWIWNNDNFLLASKGNYNRPENVYYFEGECYAMTKDQEVWAESIEYKSDIEEATFEFNVQMFDQTQNLISMGTYGKYWGIEKRGILYGNAVVINYEKPGADTLYMRSDTVIVFSVDSLGKLYDPYAVKIDSLKNSDTNVDSLNLPNDNIIQITDQQDTITVVEEIVADSLIGDSLKVESPKELKARLKREAKEAKQKLKDEKIRLKFIEDSTRQSEKLLQESIRETAKNINKLKKKFDRTGDSTILKDILSLEIQESKRVNVDSLGNPIEISEDEVIADTIGAEAMIGSIIIPNSANKPKDSIYRVVRAIDNVKIFRKDVQAVCDSLVGFTLDSTIHLFKSPILWNENNQIVADKMIFYSKNQQLEKADFIGAPLMSANVIDSLYNQIAGKEMFAKFHNNEIKEMLVDGNAQTYYYLQEDDSPDVMGFLVAESASIKFDFDSTGIDKITYYTNPVYSIFPMDKIAASQSQYLKEFKWHTDLRPKNPKEILGGRTLRKSIKDNASELFKKPEFVITQSIKDEIRILSESGTWRDRNDKLWIDIESFKNEFNF